MGNCVAPQYTKKSSTSSLTLTTAAAENWQSTAKIVHINGKLEELNQPTKANLILSQNPHCFLCSCESMYINCQVPHISEDEDLQLGQIYFLLPLSKSNFLLSLQDLCALAIKASAALDQLESPTPRRCRICIKITCFVKPRLVSTSSCEFSGWERWRSS